MGLELLTQADYVLNACGRPVPPKGYRFVDLPRFIPFHQTIQLSVSGGSGSILDENSCGLKWTNISTAIVTVTVLAGAGQTCVVTGSQSLGYTITITGVASLSDTIALLNATAGVSSLVTTVIVPGISVDPPDEILITGSTGPLSAGTFGTAFPAQDRVENASNTLFLCRGIMLQTDPLSVRVKWPTGRYWNQFPSNNPNATAGAGANFPQGTGGNLYALNEEVPIERGGKVAVEMSGLSGGTVDIQFWGVLRYLLKDTNPLAAIAAPLSENAVNGDTCIVGYPATAQSAGAPTCLIGYPVPGGAKGQAGSFYMKDPVAELKERQRFVCWPNGNIFAPEFLLGNQCETNTPPGFYDESYTFFSDAISVAANAQSYSNSVIVPGQDDIIIKRWRGILTWSDGGSGNPVIGVRSPSGYSLTGGDQIPFFLQYWIPMFPTLRLRAGTELILDVSFPGGSGTVTVQIEFDAVKRRRMQ